jgi:hypothetical protein
MFVLFLCTVVAQHRRPYLTGNLVGSVADAAEAAPVRYAFILVHGRSDTQAITVKPDEHGRFDLRLAVGLYDVFGGPFRGRTEQSPIHRASSPERFEGNQFL